MSANQTRIEVFIDVFEQKQQRALALTNLTPPELVEAILREFREIEYLGDTADDYQLIKAAAQMPLDNTSPLGQQINNQERLILVEKEVPVPPEAKRLNGQVYLREQTTGKVYKLHWQPSIIGRPDEKQAHNEWIAINLAAHTMGLRVSRRHAQITEANRRYFIESLSPQNPTAIKDTQGNATPLNEQKQPLQHGDIIYLEGSQIALKFIIRDEEHVQ